MSARLYILNQLTFDLDIFACVWAMTIARRGLRVKVIGQSQRSMHKCVCYTSIYCGILRVLIDGRSSRFPLRRHQLPASAASRAARHDQRQRRSPARVGVVTRSVWPRSSIEGSFCSEVNTKCHVTLLRSASWWCGVLAICTCNREALRSIHACWSWSAFLETASYRSVRGSTLSGGRVGVRGRFKEHTA